MTLHQLRKLPFRDSVASFFCLQLQLVPDSVELERASEISKLLAEFEDVLAELNSLSPSRHMDHQIHLTPNAQPVNVRPCRYPYSQKEEIKKLVSEMLKSGIIQPSNSPFSSLFLLVKKKNGTWL